MKNSGSGPKYDVSPMPVDLRYASALAAIVRGSFEYGCFVMASTMSQVSDSVGTFRNGSFTAEFGSGMKIMSEAWIGCQPRIELPSLNVPTSSFAMGIVVCCQIPSRSMNLKSTIFAPCFSASFRTSAGVIDVPLLLGGVGLLPEIELELERVFAALARADADGFF